MNLDEHYIDDEGEHWPEYCELCIEADESVENDCRCGKCCERLLIEASVRDAEREPRIKECSPIYDDNFGEGPQELIGFLLNDKRNHMACRFFDRGTRQCTIYDTRPVGCRIFDCDTERPERWPHDE